VPKEVWGKGEGKTLQGRNEGNRRAPRGVWGGWWRGGSIKRDGLAESSVKPGGEYKDHSVAQGKGKRQLKK